MCIKCKNSLKKKKLPKFALANNLFVGTASDLLKGKFKKLIDNLNFN